MTKTTSTYRITERRLDDDSLMRIIAELPNVEFRQARNVEIESLASDGNYVRLERLDPTTGEWEYL